jgi:hypothetical protein
MSTANRLDGFNVLNELQARLSGIALAVEFHELARGKLHQRKEMFSSGFCAPWKTTPSVSAFGLAAWRICASALTVASQDSNAASSNPHMMRMKILPINSRLLRFSAPVLCTYPDAIRDEYRSRPGKLSRMTCRRKLETPAARLSLRHSSGKIHIARFPR